ncbi:hypothetical protein EDC01DRAFT_141895 [Geopyxis carbonaria]|nr:hypothetical protein EDC01DRAFT_141895 [Geopyxis carbonaria]
MRLRLPFAGSFLFLCLVAAYLGFSTIHLPVNDKFLHFITFFLLTLCFYWILEASRRRVVNFTFGICTVVLGIGSEFVQNLVSTRKFDVFDILANLVGSALAILLCSWYHNRMLERKRLAKNYQPVASDDVEFEQDEHGIVDSQEWVAFVFGLRKRIFFFLCEGNINDTKYSGFLQLSVAAWW